MQQLQAWRDPSGFVLAKNKTGSNNGLLYSSMAVIIAHMRCELTESDKETWRSLVASCFQHPGVLDRSPGNQSQSEAQDDYRGVLSACAVIGDYKLGDMIRQYGRDHAWVYQNIDGKFPEPGQIMSRIPGFIGLCDLASGDKPSLVQKIFFSIGLIWNGFFKDGTSGTNLIWCEVKAWGFEVTVPILFWWWKLMGQSPTGMKGFFSTYFGEDHPLTMCLNE